MLIDNLENILGICLGMQLMTKGSEEGVLPGLGGVDAQVKKFSFEDKNLKVPHMGWNTVNPVKDNEIFDGFSEEIRAYFVHSYYVTCKKSDDVLAKTQYGDNFISAYKNENIIGIQFHPEKSHNKKKRFATTNYFCWKFCLFLVWCRKNCLFGL